MPRLPQGFWDVRSKRYYARLGEAHPETGKRRAVMLRHEDGSPVAEGDKRGVAAAVRRLLADRDEAERRAAGPSVARVVNEYILWHRANGSAPRTVADHEFHLGEFVRFTHEGVPYGLRPAASIGVADVARVGRAMEARGNGRGYIKLRYASILACWRWAERPVEGRVPERMIPANPLAGLRRPRRGEIVEKVIPWPLARAFLRFARGVARPRRKLRERDWPRLWSPDRDRPRWRLRILALHLAALTGCRPDEAAQITWDEIDWKKRVAVLRRGKTFGKTGRKRLIAIPGHFFRMLATWRDSPDRHPTYVFLPAKTRKTRPPTGRELGAWFRDVRDKAIAAGVAATSEGEQFALGREVTMYWFRHMFQTDGVQVASVEQVAGAAGNTAVVVESTYVHNQARNAHEVTEAVARARRGRGGGLSGPAGPSSSS